MIYDISCWLYGNVDNESSDESIIAYNVGIFESNDCYMSYLIGSKEYDPDDTGWVCKEDFSPKSKYHTLNNSKGKSRDSIESDVVNEVTEFLKSNVTKSSFFEKAQVIAVGFDDGDLVDINT